jgi:hypothetical protein
MTREYFFSAVCSVFWFLLPCPQAHARQPYGVLGPSTFRLREVPSGRDWGCSLHKSVSPGTPFLAPSRTCTLSTTAHEIWRNRLEPHRATNYEPGGTHPRSHERVYHRTRPWLPESFERLVAAPCSMSTSDGVHMYVQTSDHLDRHPELGPDIRITSGVY